ncbi:MAG: hypothetical protein JOZ49_16955 [Mycolicibacterium sp.]|nr:hypothetical protein [Mycolicibacterium sp.]
MPGDLLRYLGGPSGFSLWWLVLAGLVALVVITWYTAVFVWTLPPTRLRGIPAVRDLHARLLRRRFTRTVRDICEQHRAGGLSDGQAAGAISRTLRSFLHVRSGARTHYMHVDDIAEHTELAPAAPVFAALNDAQFSATRADVGQLGHAAEEVIRTWN